MVMLAKLMAIDPDLALYLTVSTCISVPPQCTLCLA